MFETRTYKDKKELLLRLLQENKKELFTIINQDKVIFTEQEKTEINEYLEYIKNCLKKLKELKKLL